MGTSLGLRILTGSFGDTEEVPDAKTSLTLHEGAPETDRTRHSAGQV